MISNSTDVLTLDSSFSTTCEHPIGDRVLPARTTLGHRQILEDDDRLLTYLEREVGARRMQRYHRRLGIS